MHLKVANGSIIIEAASAINGQALTPADFADKPLVVENEPAFYVAIGADGVLARSVSVNAADRKTVAALIGNWIAEGFHPVPVDVKQYAKLVRNLATARKPVKEAGTGAADGGEAGAAGAAGADAGGAGAAGGGAPGADGGDI
ncbi:hypothetical protein G3A43_08130 [Paraburkholderia aspalathi]|nr:hypothetical protein [Paraburkholderia aspalathi]MBK3780223.1 hypothetical protein [Paraburkholderia aspalathi]